jgi:hypothetical protein
MLRLAEGLSSATTPIKTFLHNRKEIFRAWSHDREQAKRVRHHECTACGNPLEKLADGTEFCNVINCIKGTPRIVDIKKKSRPRRVHPDDRLELLHDIGRHKKCARCGAYDWEQCQTVGCRLWAQQRAATRMAIVKGSNKGRFPVKPIPISQRKPAPESSPIIGSVQMPLLPPEDNLQVYRKPLNYSKPLNHRKPLDHRKLWNSNFNH